MTIHGITQQLTVPLQAVWTDDDLVVITGSVEISLADYDVTPPTAPTVLSVADVADVELQLYLTRS